MDVEEHGPGSVADVRHMHLSSGKHPDEPCVYGSEAEFSFLSLLTRSFHIVKDPSDLCGAEICIDDESGLAADKVCAAVLLKAVAVFRCPSVLPYDGIVDRGSGFCIPYDGGLTLVGDADGCDILSVDIYRSDCLCDH